MRLNTHLFVKTSTNLLNTKFVLCDVNIRTICIGRINTKFVRVNEKVNRVFYSKDSFKSFDSIPGPTSLPLIGTLWSYLPLIGEYEFSNIYGNCMKKLKKYGPLVREEILPGVKLVFLFDVKDIEDLMRATNDRPERRSHTMVMKYRQSKPNIYNSGGLLPTNGEEWYKIRSKFQKPLSSPQKAAIYIGKTDLIVTEFINKIKEDIIWKDNIDQVDFLQYLSRLYLQMICLIAFDANLGSFSKDQMRPDSLSSKLIKATIDASRNVVKTDSIPEFISNYFPTKAHKEVIEAQKTIEKVACDLISKGKNEGTNRDKEIENNEETSLLQTYLSDTNYDLKDIIGMCVDLLLAGVDTTSYSTSFALYHLSQNKDVQEKLYSESLNLLPDSRNKISGEVLSKATYLKAVVKETLRLNPISIGIGRILTKDVVLSGYLIPSGTVAVTANQVCSRDPKYFEKSEEFIPERWLRDGDFPKPTSPFASIPFGHGPRMCIARRLAEQNMYIVLLKLVRTFEIGWNGQHLDFISESINRPSRSISITLKSRNE